MTPSTLRPRQDRLVSARHRQRVLDFIEDWQGQWRQSSLPEDRGTDESAISDGSSKPTVFADVANSDRIAREEIFGPVLTVNLVYDFEVRGHRHRQRQRVRTGRHCVVD